MTVETTCSGCGKKLTVGDEHAGKRARCPACGQIYTVPFPGQASELDSSPQSGVSDGSNQTAAASAAAANSPFGSDPFSGSAQPDQLWMRAADGSMYGPVDRPTMDRWFREGRVGVGYQIRVGEYGSWTSPDAFRPATYTTTASPTPGTSGRPINPYENTNPYMPSGPAVTYPKADQSVVIIVLAIVGFIICPVFSLVAWIMAGTALKDIQAGLVSPSNKGVIQAGYYLGLINCILALLSILGVFVVLALAVVGAAV